MLCFWFHTICDDSNCAIRSSVAVNLKRHYFAFVLIVNPPTELTRSLSETSPLNYDTHPSRGGLGSLFICVVEKNNKLKENPSVTTIFMPQ